MSEYNMTGLLYGRAFFGNAGKRKPLDPAKHSPYVFRNRDALDAALKGAKCHRCGYSGTSLHMAPPHGEKSAAQAIFSSERGFLRRMARAKPTCFNCTAEAGAKPMQARGKPRVRALPMTLYKAMAFVKADAPAPSNPHQTDLFSETLKMVETSTIATISSPDAEPQSLDLQ